MGKKKKRRKALNQRLIALGALLGGLAALIEAIGEWFHD